MMISSAQIKAARAMMDWTQMMLAQESGLSHNTICSLEKGHQSIRSLLDVRKTFEERGFEFIGMTGLMRRTADESRIYEGADACDRFYDDLLTTIKERGGEVAAIFKSQEFLTRSLGIEDHDQRERLEMLSKHATTIKCLFTDARHSSLSIPSFEFRAMPHPYAPLASFIYGDKSAYIATDTVGFVYMVMKSVDRTKNNWKNFRPRWDSAVPLTTQAKPPK
jgi:transcriptional regulator with XRE-family HTH domain